MSTTTQRLLQAHPFCCFCGGEEKAVNLDHQPARIMFPDKHRPKGLEFPACAVCNQQTRHDEALVAFFARVTGNHRYSGGRFEKGLSNAIIAVSRAFPLLLAQIVRPLWVQDRGLLIRRFSVNGKHAQVVRSACIVAAKLCLAAYYDHHGKPAPATAKINTMWTHNQNQNTNLAVDNILRTMPDVKRLKQRTWDTEDSFFLRYFAEEEAFMMVAILHESLALMAQVTDAKYAEGWMAWHHVWVPLKGQGIMPFRRAFETSDRVLVAEVPVALGWATPGGLHTKTCPKMKTRNAGKSAVLMPSSKQTAPTPPVGPMNKAKLSPIGAHNHPFSKTVGTRISPYPRQIPANG